MSGPSSAHGWLDMRVALPLLVVLLAGCVNTLAQRQAKLAPLIGQSEQTLIQAMGVPSRSYDVSGTKYLAYDQRSTTVLPGYGPWGPWPYGWYGYGSGVGFPPEVVDLLCETTFVVAGGVVRSFNFRGNAC